MRKRGLTMALGLALLLLAGGVAYAADPLVVVFHLEGCPDCAFMQTVLDGLVADHPDLTIAYHEFSEAGASDLLSHLLQADGATAESFPVIFVGQNAPIVGAGRAQELALREAVAACLSGSCASPMTRAAGPPIAWGDLLIVAGFLVLLLLFSFMQGLGSSP